MELKEYELGQLLTYEQPTAYIVKSTEYNYNYKTPVLTAGKSFILGYTNEKENIFDKLPVIIFDDFTTATQYVNFEFKVKSSAMKILHINTELVNPKYIYYRMQIIQFDHSTHKRYWIQQYSKLKVQIPPLVEQERIVAKIEELFSDLDNAVETLNATKAQLAVYRQSVLKEAFDIDRFPKVKMENIVDDIKIGPFGTMLHNIIAYLEKSATGTTMKNLNEKIVKHIPVPMITREKQLELTSFLEDRLSICENIEKTVDSVLQQASAMRQSILKQAFEGRLL